MIAAIGDGRQRQEYLLSMQAAIESRFAKVEPMSESVLRIYDGDMWQDYDLENE